MGEGYALTSPRVVQESAFAIAATIAVLPLAQIPPKSLSHGMVSFLKTHYWTFLAAFFGFQFVCE